MRSSTATLEHMKLVVTKMDGDGDKPSLNLNEFSKHKDAFQSVTKVHPRRNPTLAQSSKTIRAAMTKTTLYPFFASPEHMPNKPDNERRAAMLTSLEAKCAQHTLDSIDISNFPLDDILQVGPRGTPRLAAVMQQCPQLRSLTLVDTGVRQWREIALALASCPQLQRVDFSCNRIANPGLSYPLLCISLQNHNELSDIDFSDCSLSTYSSFLATACSRCPALTKLNVSGNHLDDDGNNSLISILPACHNLQHLNLSFNGLRTNGHAQVLGYRLRSCTALTHLDLSRNFFDTLDMTTIAQDLVQCTTLRHLSLRGCIYVRGRGLCHLAALGVLRPLTSLDLSKCDFNFADPAGVQTWPTTPAALAELHRDLSQCTNLTRLNLAHNRLGDCFLDGFVTTFLPACTALAHLDLEDTEISNMGTRRLARLVPRIPNLVDLNLSTNNLNAETIADVRQAWVRTHAHAHGLRMDA
jgi:Ran GTPase-activating protein (RanGAP) involved in mRNA processing and transport